MFLANQFRNREGRGNQSSTGRQVGRTSGGVGSSKLGTGTFAEVVRRGLKEEVDLEQQSMQRQEQDQKVPIVDKEDDKRERVEETADSKKVPENREDEVEIETGNRPEVAIAGKGVEESTGKEETYSNAVINDLSHAQETQRETEATVWSQNSNKEGN
ncbi:hypothetical protein L6452_42229 [Arctium lappa]|uniref:Uncharacterized protein n=1 Tax=Arctium lappa TaxID=4217 RepID=A0ACB8XI30_ARCLA|nr:hypothetical protein L6452_42229 [Arctium lappa]